MGKQWKLSDFIFLGSKITADGEIKRRLLLGRKVMTYLDSIFKSRDSTLPTKVCLVKAMVFPVVMYGCESWTVKKAEHRRIDAFELWCWRRLLILKDVLPTPCHPLQRECFLLQSCSKCSLNSGHTSQRCWSHLVAASVLSSHSCPALARRALRLGTWSHWSLCLPQGPA